MIATLLQGLWPFYLPLSDLKGNQRTAASSGKVAISRVESCQFPMLLEVTIEPLPESSKNLLNNIAEKILASPQA